MQEVLLLFLTDNTTPSILYLRALLAARGRKLEIGKYLYQQGTYEVHTLGVD